MNNTANVLVKFTGDTKNLDTATNKASASLGKFKGIAKGVGASVAAALATAVAVATSKLIELSKESLKARADLEQNLGGINKLFGQSADEIIANSKRAYQTAGISANRYMETATSFSASLLRGLGNDTKTAAALTDRAIKDMSDNANTFGTSMDEVINVYKALSKEQYTTLDNLRLGYAGTKKGMQQLISDASKYTDIQKELNISVEDGNMSFDNIIKAISVMQKHLNIMGTTEKEAAETITGSINSAKAAWENFLAGVTPASDVVKAVVVAAKRVAKELVKIVPDIAKGLVDLVNGLIPQIPNLILQLIPVLVQGVISLIQGLAPVLPQIIDALLKGVISIVDALADALPDLLPVLVDAIVDIIPVLIDNLPLFIEAGIKLIVGIALGIVQATPRLLALIPKLVKSIVKYFLNLPNMLFNIAKNTLMQFGNVFVKNVNTVYNNIKNFSKKVISTIKTILTPGALKNIGHNLISGLWNGIKAKFDSVVEGVKSLAAKLPKAVKKVLGIASPSKVMFSLGGYTTEGFINGIESMQKELDKTMAATFSLSPSVANSVSTNLSPQINVINNIHSEIDPLGQVVNKIKTFQSGAKNDYNYGKA